MLSLSTMLLVMVFPMLPPLLVSMELPQLQFQQFMMPMLVLVDMLLTLLELFMLQSVKLMLNQKRMLMHCMVLMDIVDCMDMDTVLDTVLTLLDMVRDIPGMDTMARDLLSDLGMDILVLIMGMAMVMDMDTMDKLTAGSNKSKASKDTTLDSRISSPIKLIPSYTSFFFCLYIK